MAKRWVAMRSFQCLETEADLTRTARGSRQAPKSSVGRVSRRVMRVQWWRKAGCVMRLEARRMKGAVVSFSFARVVLGSMWVTKGKTLERITNRRNTSNVTESESTSRDSHGVVLEWRLTISTRNRDSQCRGAIGQRRSRCRCAGQLTIARMGRATIFIRPLRQAAPWTSATPTLPCRGSRPNYPTALGLENSCSTTARHHNPCFTRKTIHKE
ncbi:hypothetical protein M441DRAFT_273185 [Trichoderma asperellum CBS 433.97]|uniref:Uncharacterized protein n=1 Tax=Trichoderma asperellum (strain ATCC 204424 / CBS 433.97 / NBRC 101777) TaxID=1042311 RepID=A0A2T3YWN5_TRIA4|nr:hypothetical protein M441DRAFT_273185 [Trichoderma asperellum CBS 433.97]PTB36969.1 hypothetical protein M441DRAFT_273185 [Trichoderma asperellum CBS 433.97]